MPPHKRISFFLQLTVLLSTGCRATIIQQYAAHAPSYSITFICLSPLLPIRRRFCIFWNESHSTMRSVMGKEDGKSEQSGFRWLCSIRSWDQKVKLRSAGSIVIVLLLALSKKFKQKSKIHKMACLSLDLTLEIQNISESDWISKVQLKSNSKQAAKCTVEKCLWKLPNNIWFWGAKFVMQNFLQGSKIIDLHCLSSIICLGTLITLSTLPACWTMKEHCWDHSSVHTAFSFYYDLC